MVEQFYPSRFTQMHSCPVSHRCYGAVESYVPGGVHLLLSDVQAFRESGFLGVAQPYDREQSFYPA